MKLKVCLVDRELAVHCIVEAVEVATSYSEYQLILEIALTLANDHGEGGRGEGGRERREGGKGREGGVGGRGGRERKRRSYRKRSGKKDLVGRTCGRERGGGRVMECVLCGTRLKERKAIV